MPNLEFQLEQFRSQSFNAIDRLIYRQKQELLDLQPLSVGAAKVIRDLDSFANFSMLSSKLSLHLIAQLPPRVDSRPIRILEVCAGSGWLSRSLAKKLALRCDHFEITASDLRLPELPPSERVQTHIADATNLPFLDKSFDLVVCAQALHHFAPSILALVLNEAVRVGRGISLFDLRRTSYGVAMMGLIAPFYSREFILDGIVSHRRAYSINEMRFLIKKTELSLAVRKFLPVGMLVESLGEA